MNNNNPSNNVPGQSQGDATGNPQPNVGGSGLEAGQSNTSEELQRQLADAQKKVAEYESEAFKRREKERERKQQEAADKAALEQRLKEQGEYKTLADQLATTVDDLKAQIAQRDQELAQRDYEALRAKVAAKHGLPTELAARLTGSNEAELEADAGTLKKLIGEQVQTARSPGNAPGPRPAGAGAEQGTDELRQRYRQSGKYAF